MFVVLLSPKQLTLMDHTSSACFFLSHCASPPRTCWDLNPLFAQAQTLVPPQQEGKQAQRSSNDAGHADVRAHVQTHTLHTCISTTLACAGARYEAALYGALCAYLPATLAVCGSWEDACWAYCR